MQLWRIGIDTLEARADDLRGRGAELHGGRWNRPGRPLVYASTTIALACLETVVHVGAGNLPLRRQLIRVEIPDPVWSARDMLSLETLPRGWNALPAGHISFDFGDAWLGRARAALLVVPSAIIPEECNVLINPLHADAALITASRQRPWTYDGRLLA